MIDTTTTTAATTASTEQARPVCYSYRRWSTAAQTDGHSLARQTTAADRWATENGYRLDTTLTFTDAGLSAYKGRNATEGALAAFLEACRSGRIAKGSVLIVESLDRISRDVVRKAARTLEDICSEGVDVIDLSDGGRRYSLESLDAEPTQFIVMTLHFMRANQESVLKGQRVRAARANGRKEARDNHRLFTSMLPMWLQAPPAGKTTTADIVVLEDRAAVVRGIFEALVAGAGQHTIAADLTKQGVTPWGSSGRWTRSYIQRILRSKSVIGTFTPHQVEVVGGIRRYKPEGAPIENYLPAIIVPSLWHAAQARLAEVQPRGKAAEKPIRNLLQGLCRCSICGGTMSKVRAKFLVCGEANARQKHKPMPVPYLKVVNALLEQLPPIIAETPRGSDGAQLAEQIDETKHNVFVGECLQQELVDEIVNASPAERTALRRKLAELSSETEARKATLEKLLARVHDTETTDVTARLDALTEALKPSESLLAGDDAATETTNRALKRAIASIDFDAKSGSMTIHWRHMPDADVGYFGEIRFSSPWIFDRLPGGYTVPTQRRPRRGRKTVDSSSAVE
jgi:DNA invertase Pin-like site-specific DNA recombinase